MNISEIEAREREIARLDKIRNRAMRGTSEEQGNGTEGDRPVEHMVIRRRKILENYVEEGGDGQDIEEIY